MLNDETNTLALETETTIEQAAPETETKQEDGPVSLDSNSETETEATPETGDADETEGDDNPEYAVIDYDGEQFQVPPKLKEAFLRQQDYTRKTQEVATERKAVEAEKQQLASMREASQEELSARAALINFDQALKQYEGFDWNSYDPNDPLSEVEMSRHWRNFQTLQQQRQQVGQYLQNAENNRAVEAQQVTAKRLQETLEFAQKEIPGWTPDMDAKITDFATKELGYPVDTLKTAYNPQIYRTLYLAWHGLQSLNKSAAKPAIQALKPQPLQRVSSKASVPAVSDPGKMSMDEYAAWRKANP